MVNFVVWETDMEYLCPLNQKNESIQFKGSAFWGI